LVTLNHQLGQRRRGRQYRGSADAEIQLGPIGNSIAGIVGGGLGGQLLSMLTAGGATAAGASASGMDLSSILSSVAGGGVGGGIVMAIVGLIRSQMAKS
jgi:hypothetical protein